MKGQAENYFAISEFPNWIAKRFKALRASTETYLVHGRSHIIGDESIGEATFFGLKGRDLCAQSIVPEIYDHHYPKRSQVERFLIDEACPQQLTRQDKKLLHDYLVGCLSSDAIEMARTLFTFFSELEGYLRANFREFIVRITHKQLREVYERARIEESKKFPSLGDVLKLYSVAISICNEEETAHLVGGWEELATLRNQVAHGALDCGSGWREPLRILLKQLPRVRQLLALVESVTGKQCSCEYV
jgi:hypothetical protein